ncbi:MAG: arylamine N-acetyltransferase [Candidatus Marinimicrobia bacterium]|nr:arylamine N-acetyltransferase [Candidatus Neomarinimicrobiota bacterium]MCF7840343.1 arylamine N-acetyltransferase [Candidatus Neomarinimicrobiota bacterium]MCF7902407.1 arylamine N-acetyltransferase [Candidatus Neomarinimicrobiota bacterium]
MNLQSLISPALDPSRFGDVVTDFLSHHHWQASRPSLAHIAELSRQFGRLPYENLSKIINLSQYPDAPPLRMPDTVWDGFQRQHLGGTCYALTFFLTTILQFFNYDARPVTAEMNWGKDVHSAIIINFQGIPYLLDPGYLIHQPLPLSPTTPQHLHYPHLTVELRADSERETFSVYTWRKGQATWRYRFHSNPLDWETYARRWRHSFALPSMDGLVITRVTPTGMIYIHNDYLRITRTGGVQKVRDQNMVEQTIQESFGIDMRIVEAARLALRQNRSGKQTQTGDEDATR